MKRFIAVDGESVTRPNSHDYVLLANSYGQHVWDTDGLSTKACLDFLLAMPKSKSTIFVAFGWNYDVNMILRDLTPSELEELRDNKKLSWNDYELEWIPSKWFTVKQGDISRRIHEVFGFFQSSFVNALKDWGYEPPKEIASMKEQRSDFTDKMKAEIISYCVSECNYLTKLMGKLADALASVDLTPSNWIGAGSIAAALLREKNVKEHHMYDNEFGEQFHLASLTAYFGGRVELFKQGSFSNLYDYDIVSAYPYAAQNLPSLVGAKVTEHDGYVKADYGMYLCNWQLSEDTIICPFPVRKGGAIFYPTNGRGWYHSPEVEHALQTYPDSITVERTIQVHPTNSSKPFAFISTVFTERARLKREGHAGQKALKLGLNSLYGKLAQGIGYRDTLPPFQSYYWAGYITSCTRARALQIAAHNPSALVMIATDGIFFDEEVTLPTSSELGGLELEILSSAFVAQPGVYSATKSNGKKYSRSRGFFAREIDFEELEAGYAKNSFYHVAEYESTRFIGLLSALHTNNIEDWRTWKTSPRKLSLYPNRKWPSGDSPTLHLPPSLKEIECSAPYVPKGGTQVFPPEIDPLEFIQGMEQPLRS